MSIIDDAKSVAKLIQDVGNIELKQMIVNLQGEIVNLVQERNELREQVGELENALKIKKSLTFEDNAYWVVKEDKAREGPFCPACWDSKNQLIHLVDAGGSYSPFVCPSCKMHYRTYLTS